MRIPEDVSIGDEIVFTDIYSGKIFSYVVNHIVGDVYEVSFKDGYKAKLKKYFEWNTYTIILKKSNEMYDKLERILSC